MQDQELNSMILASPLKFRIFYGSMTFYAPSEFNMGAFLLGIKLKLQSPQLPPPSGKPATKVGQYIPVRTILKMGH